MEHNLIINIKRNPFSLKYSDTKLTIKLIFHTIVDNNFYILRT